jgi:ppGpp synthetase/RelA/SpoT-type nucleotidyltranferase
VVLKLGALLKDVRDAEGHLHSGQTGEFESQPGSGKPREAEPQPREQAPSKPTAANARPLRHDALAAIAQHRPFFAELKGKLEAAFPDAKVSGRIKTVKSIVEKVLKDPDDKFGDVSDIHDISATRVEVPFSEIPLAAAQVRKMFHVIKEDDYIAHPKAGYRGLHFNVEKKGLIGEVQVRSPRMSQWAEWAHDQLYKVPERKRALIEANRSVMDDYANKMSDYVYALDNNRQQPIPDCPPIVAQTLGVLHVH